MEIKQHRARNFTIWLDRQRTRADLVGDLAFIASYDRKFPRVARLWRTYHRHLEQIGADKTVFFALDLAWQEWERYCSESDRPN